MLLLSLSLLLLLHLSFALHGSLLDFLLTEEVLSGLHLDILDSRLLLGREGRVFLLLDGGFLFLFHLDLLEFWQEPVPIFLLKSLVLHELAFDHEFLDMIDGMDVLHGVYHDSPHDLYVLEATDQTDSSTLHQDITLCQ